MAKKGKDKDGQAEEVIASQNRIHELEHERQQFLESLLNCEEQLAQIRYLSENLAEGMVYQINSGPDGKERRFTYLSPAVERYHGLKVEAVLQDPMLLYDQVVEEDRALVADMEAHAYATRTRLDVDVRVLLPSGELRWRRFMSSPRACPDGSTAWDGIEVDITGRKQAEDALRKNEERWRGLIETSAAWIWATDADIRHIYTNAFVTKYLGYQPQEFLSLDSLALIHPEDQALVRRLVEDAIALKTGWVDQVMRWRHKDGSWRYIESSGTPLFDDKGHFIGLHGVDRDITERRSAEEKLRESEEKYKFLVETTNTGYVILGEDGLVVDANSEYVRMTGHDRLESILGRSVVEWTAAHDQERNAEEVKACLQKGFVRNLEIDYVDKQGRFIPVEINATVMHSDNSLMIFTICRDITERKRVEDEVEERGALLQQILDTSSVAIFLVDREGRITHANRRMAEMFGYPMEELIGSEYVEHVHPAERETGRQKMLALLASEIQHVDLERYYWCKDGTEFWGHLVGRRFHDVHGKELGLIGVISDISGRKSAEEQLLASEKRFRTIVEHAAEGILVADAETRAFRFANPEICRMLGYTLPEIMMLKVEDIHPAEELQTVEEGFSRQLTGDSLDVQTMCLRKDGSLFPVSIRSVAIEMDGLPCLMGFFSDITERHLLENERMKTGKLEATGLLAGGIAHDFNNLLQGIFGYIAMAKMDIDNKERTLEMLEQAEKGLHLSVNLTTQLLTFSKGGKPVKKLLKVRTVIENAVRFALSGSSTDYSIEVADDIMSVEADEGQLAQVIQNIVLNADQAMPLGGTVRVTARNLHGSDIKTGGLSGETNYVEIAIMDSGVGIPKQYLLSIFDPYFTTKEKGSGIGLATSYSIIKNHGGLINVESEVGRGSTFFVYLPGIERKEEVRVEPQTDPVARSARVLVMDDDELVRALLAEIMKTLGHEAVCVADGEAALSEYRAAMESGRAFDLVILDLTVRGGMGGEEAIQRLLLIDPDIRAVVSSGYSESSIISDYLAHGFKAYLGKPYRINELKEVMSRLLT